MTLTRTSPKIKCQMSARKFDRKEKCWVGFSIHLRLSFSVPFLSTRLFNNFYPNCAGATFAITSLISLHVQTGSGARFSRSGKAKEMARHIRRRDKYARQKGPEGSSGRTKASCRRIAAHRSEIIEASSEEARQEVCLGVHDRKIVDRASRVGQDFASACDELKLLYNYSSAGDAERFFETSRANVNSLKYVRIHRFDSFEIMLVWTSCALVVRGNYAIKLLCISVSRKEDFTTP